MQNFSLPEEPNLINSRTTSDQDSPKADKRYLPRWQVNNRVSCTLLGERHSHAGVSRDLNCMGMSFISETRFLPNQKVKLKIHLSEDTVVKVEGYIVWTRSAGDGFASGILFENLSLEAQDLLLQYAYEIKKDDVVDHWFTGWSKK